MIKFSSRQSCSSTTDVFHIYHIFFHRLNFYTADRYPNRIRNFNRLKNINLFNTHKWLFVCLFFSRHFMKMKCKRIFFNLLAILLNSQNHISDRIYLIFQMAMKCLAISANGENIRHQTLLKYTHVYDTFICRRIFV